jgi:hypothetical protein
VTSIMDHATYIDHIINELSILQSKSVIVICTFCFVIIQSLTISLPVNLLRKQRI